MKNCKKKNSYRDIRFYSAILSATAICISPFSSATPGDKESEIWLLCETSLTTSVKCDDSNLYKRISDPFLIDKLKKEMAQKNDDELIIKTVELAKDEIDKFFNYAIASNPEYIEPRLNFGMLDKSQEKNIKEEIKAIIEILKKEPDISGDDLYHNPKLKLDKMPKKRFDETLRQIRRDNYGILPRPGQYIAAGAVAVKAAEIVNDIVSQQFDPKFNNPKKDPQKKPIEDYYDKIIPILFNKK